MSKANVDYRLANARQQPLPRFMKAYAQVTPRIHLFDRSNLNIVTPATPKSTKYRNGSANNHHAEVYKGLDNPSLGAPNQPS
jgi:hypothetical protein